MAGWGALATRGIRAAQRKYATSKALDTFTGIVEQSSLRFRIDLASQSIEESSTSDTRPFTTYVTSWELIQRGWPPPGLENKDRQALVRGFVHSPKELCERLGGHELVLFEVSKNGWVAPFRFSSQKAEALDVRVLWVARLVEGCGRRMFPSGSLPMGINGLTRPPHVGPIVSGPTAPTGPDIGGRRPQAAFCPGCGSQLEQDDQFCTRCGRQAV